MTMHGSILLEDMLVDDSPEDILFIHEIAEDMREIAILDELVIAILEDNDNEQS